MSVQQLELPREHVLVSMEFFIPSDATDAEIRTAALRAAYSAIPAIRRGLA